MRRFPLFACSFLSLLIGVAAVGCGSKSGEATPTASIDAPPAEATPSLAARKKMDRQHPVVRLQTSLGDITVKLDGEAAPLTVDNFMAYVDAGHYDQTIFHQVVDGFIVLGGGFDSSGQERTVHQSVRNEAHNGLKNKRGALSMARESDIIDSSTSQFFINLADNPSLDYQTSDTAGYGYCVFGEVIGGMDVVEQIGKSKTQNTDQFESVPVKPVVILKAERVSL